jgi:hypothetical protein
MMTKIDKQAWGELVLLAELAVEEAKLELGIDPSEQLHEEHVADMISERAVELMMERLYPLENKTVLN